MVKGTQTGVSSDVEGNYEIVVPGPGSVLVFNYLGYQPQEIAVGNRTQIDVRLAEDNNVLDDVVVIGYGTQSRRTLTSAVSKVSGADLEGVPVNSIGDALKGKVPGVRVSTANNQPGSDPVFLIRGGSSINQSNAPIIIVDGVRREMTRTQYERHRVDRDPEGRRFGGYLRSQRVERRDSGDHQEG